MSPIDGIRGEGRDPKLKEYHPRTTEQFVNEYLTTLTFMAMHTKNHAACSRNEISMIRAIITPDYILSHSQIQQLRESLNQLVIASEALTKALDDINFLLK